MNRTLSQETPRPEQDSTAELSSPLGSLMPPPPARPSRKRKQIVLEEEEWIAAMEGIIERDFFPDLPDLQNKTQWLEAMRQGDLTKAREAQLRMSLSNAREAFSSVDAPYRGDHGHEPAAEPISRVSPPPNVSLDQFLALHTSEDNQSFSEILERTTERRRRQMAAYFKHGAKLLKDSSSNGKELNGASQTLGWQTDTAAWKQGQKNLLMFDGSTRHSLALSPSERETITQGSTASINHRGTRLSRLSSSSAPSPPTNSSIDDVGGSEDGISSASAEAPTRMISKRHNKMNARDEYDILSTPSFAPGEDASPFMVWGAVEATPLRLDGEDTPSVGDAGTMRDGGNTSSFRIKETPKREQRGHELASRASSALRKRMHRSSAPGSTPVAATVRAALEKATPGSSTRGNVTLQERSRGGQTPLSSAAQRLAENLAKHAAKGKSDDWGLRSSYHGSRTRGPSGTPLHEGSNNWTPQDSITE